MSSAQAKSGHDYGLKAKYGNFIGGEWIAPAGGEYFEDISPVTGEAMTLIPRSRAEDIDRALDAAHAAAPAWGKTSPAERSAMLLKIADRMEENLPMLAEVETWDNGKAFAKPRLPICRWPSIIFAISRPRFAPKPARCAISMPAPYRWKYTNLSASSVRSSRGISQS